MRIISVSIILFLISSGTAYSDIILDQSYSAKADAHAYFGANREFAQSFTVGVSGILTRIQLPTLRHGETNGGDLLFRIYSIEEVFPTTLLHEVRFLHSEIGTGLVVDLLGAGMAVATGDRLVFAVTGTGDSKDFLISGALEGREPTYEPGYPYGESFERYTAYPIWHRYGVAFGDFFPINFFFSTYVDTTPVPEPSSLLLLLVGVGSVAYRKGRSRH